VIYAITPYGRWGPSSRVRVYEWLERIAEPHRVSGYISQRNAAPATVARHPIAVLAAERRLRRIAAERPQMLLLHREASPLSRGHLERRLLDSAGFAVYDFDDALQWDHGEGGVLRRLAPKAPKALAAVRHADRVTAGNPILAEWAAEHNSDVVVVPSCVAPERYSAKRDYAVADPPRLGWVGSADSEPYLLAIGPALEEVHRRSGARVTLLGTAWPRLGRLEALIDRVAWTEQAQHELLAGFDVGLAPLPDDAYERGKCGYKLLQYAAAGTPLVASPVGVNGEILAQLGMPAAETTADWVEAIVELLEDGTERRATRGRHARRMVEERFSFDAWLPRWCAAMGLDR
jgi:glycosyltransferase involved in cell wall biosynthesis